MVPNTWSINKLEELASVERGKFSARPRNDPKYYGGEIPFVQTGDIAAAKTYLQSYSQTLNEDGLAVSRLFPKNTILITIAANIGDTAITTFDVACPDSLVAIQAYSDISDSRWLIAYLETCKEELDSKATQNAQKNINLQVLRPLEILTPPLPEQQKIATILHTWDKAISTTERLIDNSKEQKKALMQQLLTGKNRFASFEAEFTVREGFAKRKLGGLPSDWGVDLMSNHYWYQEGPGVRKHQFTETGVKLFNGTNIQKSRINIKNTKTHISEEEANGPYSHFLADDGDLVIACSGISVDKFDEKIAFIDVSHLPLCMNTSTMRFKVINQKKACIHYLRYYMMSTLFKNQIRRQITGSAQLNFGPSHVSNCFIALPTFEEQQKIALVLTNADKEIDLLEQQLADLKQEKKALMQQLLTGKRRIKIDNTEAA
jgi:type I restriction enzyme S subunit